MNRFHCLTHVIIVVCSTAVLLGTSWTVHAGSFSDTFKNFVLGSEASAGVLPAVQFPASSQANACMQCHNGSAGTRISMKHAGISMQFRGNMSIEHPVGMDYRQHADKNPDTYVAPAHMDKRIAFEAGKVTCITCHQTQNEPAALPGIPQARADSQYCNVDTGFTTGPSQTRLCMSCHAM